MTQLSPQYEVSLCAITSPWSQLFSHRGHMREGKNKWHNFLHLSTSVSHVTSILADLVTLFSPSCRNSKQAIQLGLITQTRCEALSQICVRFEAFRLDYPWDRSSLVCWTHASATPGSRSAEERRRPGLWVEGLVCSKPGLSAEQITGCITLPTSTLALMRREPFNSPHIDEL